jgi:hypothetical protein
MGFVYCPVRVSLAVAGGPEPVVYLHPGSDYGLCRCDVPAEERIASSRRAGRGISSTLHAMYTMRPRVTPHPHKRSKATRRRGRHCSVAWVRVQAQVDCRCGGGGLQLGRLPLRSAQWRRQQLQQAIATLRWRSSMTTSSILLQDRALLPRPLSRMSSLNPPRSLA